jgi:hypothetical protein
VGVPGGVEGAGVEGAGSLGGVGGGAVLVGFPQTFSPQTLVATHSAPLQVEELLHWIVQKVDPSFHSTQRLDWQSLSSWQASPYWPVPVPPPPGGHGWLPQP